MPTISQRWDIKSLIEHKAGINVVSSAVVRGIREYHSNCPWCYGTDRFITRPETGQYTCATRSSGCGRHGDALDFLQDYCNMSLPEAIEELALENVSFYENKAPRVTSLNHAAPLVKWQDAAVWVVERGEYYLWSEIGKEALAYLRSRGLTDETIRKFHLGYMPLDKEGRWVKFGFDFWGLKEEDLTEKQREKGGVQIPDGILIPWYVDGSIWKISVKRPGKTPDYGQIMGSSDCLFNVDSIEYDKPAMMVEAEFCAMSVAQEAGDLVSCVATSGDKRGRIPRSISDLTIASFVLQSFDNDESGEIASKHWTEKALKRCMRWSPWIVKDPNDMLKVQDNSLSVQEWVEAGIYCGSVEYGIIPDPNATLARESSSESSQIFVDEQEWSHVNTFDSLSIGQETPPESHQNRILSKDEIIDLFRNEVSRLWGSCEIHFDPPGYTLAQHVKEIEKEKNKKRTLEDYWREVREKLTAQYYYKNNTTVLETSS